MSDDRDPVLAEALHRVAVPDHGPAFWSELDSRLDRASAPATHETRSAFRTPDDEDDARIVPLLPPGERRRVRSVTWLASVAAALVVLVAAVVVARAEPGSERLRVADPSTTEPGVTSPPTTPPPPPLPADALDTPERAVVTWLEAVGAGDTAQAASLTGPRSKAYVDALRGGAGIEGFLIEASEGYGAWADAPDRSTTEVGLDVAGEDITIVIVSGTWTGEGFTEFRTDAIPVVRAAGGTWLVEPWAIDRATGGRIEVVSPAGGDEGGFRGQAPDAVLSASAPGGGTFHFSLDGQKATAVPGQRTAGGVQATFDPPGAMTSRTHVFVIAYVDGATVSALAGSFLVEG